MKFKGLLGFMLLAIFCLSCITVAKAEKPVCMFQGTLIPASQIEKNVQSMGYTVLKTKLDECIYQVKVKDSSGQKWKLFLNPTTGKLIAKKSKHD